MSVWFYVGIMWLVIGITSNQPAFIIMSIVWFMLAANDN